MKNLVLTERLKTVARYIAPGAVAADIGTDHGYIPVYLAQHNIARRIIATDNKKGPLQRARLSAEEYGVGDRIEFVLTDGLEGLEGFEIDTVMMAGMGGETIIDILDRAPWAKTDKMRLILQPQSKLGELSLWLDSNGYAIYDETLVEDDRRLYAVLLAGTGQSRAPLSDAEIIADRILLGKRDPLLPRYLDTLIEKTIRTIRGMEKARHGDHVEALARQKRALEGFMKMKEETEKWPL